MNYIAIGHEDSWWIFYQDDNEFSPFLLMTSVPSATATGNLREFIIICCPGRENSKGYSDTANRLQTIPKCLVVCSGQTSNEFPFWARYVAVWPGVFQHYWWSTKSNQEVHVFFFLSHFNCRGLTARWRCGTVRPGLKDKLVSRRLTEPEQVLTVNVNWDNAFLLSNIHESRLHCSPCCMPISNCQLHLQLKGAWWWKW